MTNIILNNKSYKFYYVLETLLFIKITVSSLIIILYIGQLGVYNQFHDVW